MKLYNLHISTFHQAYLHHLFDASCAQRKPSSAAIEQKKKEVKGVVHQIFSPISNYESKNFFTEYLLWFLFQLANWEKNSVLDQ